ncbi:MULTISPECIES: septal ring lytic transglycosylase RlpA family protein [unclassified Flavobacterium]|jgi:rare lipoprotein A|uniref:septal ring lytic transglycosylase RlpA family protein n=1 Tax=unclassified Flavobacterium TaxID=196869 RepID=UPI0032607A55
MKKSITLIIFITMIGIAVSQTATPSKQSMLNTKGVSLKVSSNKGPVEKDSIKKDRTITNIQEKKADSMMATLGTFKLYKKESHASYYADKFNGKKTSSGRRFDNSKLTAAHKKLPFGTKVRVTNEKNGKSVIVEVIDRGPFVRSREIDLTKRAFMEIASNKGSGGMLVTLEVLNN